MSSLNMRELNALRLLAVLAGWLSMASFVQAYAHVTVSPASTAQQANLVDVGEVIKDATLEIRYAGQHNFVGRPIEGYQAPKCYLLAPVAEALKQVSDELRPQGLRLHLFDCYRPVRAVRDFVAWSRDLSDQRTKPEFYPGLEKSQLLGDYIAETSGHSRGATVDLSLDDCSGGDDCSRLDMGTAFDLFDPLANTDDPRISPQQRANRQHLLRVMAKHGFANYPMEWWHYTFKPEPTPHTAYDVPVE